MYLSTRVWFCDKAEEICVRTERLALAHCFNVLSRYNNALLLLLLHLIHIAYYIRTANGVRVNLNNV